MKSITLKALVILAGVFSAASALAQSGPVIADVPFAFGVDNTVLPAGRYELQRVSDQQIPGGILVRNIDQPRYSAMTLGAEGSWEQTPSYKANAERLVFDNDRGRYFLREVRGPVASLNLEFPITKAEKTAERTTTVASNVTQTIIFAGQ
jgi:hypothetical protein